MSKRPLPVWLLTADWGLGADPHNWILYYKGGNSWQPRGYYPSVEQLLESFYRRLTRTEPANSDLVEHVKALSDRVQAVADGLFDYINSLSAERMK